MSSNDEVDSFLLGPRRKPVSSTPTLTSSPSLRYNLSLEHFDYQEETFQFTPEEFQWQLSKWVTEGWPVQFLVRDHYGAKIFYDNGVFSLMEFYGHEWKWDDDKGLSILYRETMEETESKWVYWNDIVAKIPIQKTPQGWLLFDGWNYLQEGLIPVHLWQWKELTPAYVFPQDQKPDHCYIDFIAYCWEHEGMQGFGFGTPHGHLALEFGDDLGNFYCVGMYMDPRSKINTKLAPGATVRAVLMSPDPYMPSHGEKTLHRYFLGRGEEGRENLSKLKKHIESIQDWKIDEVTKRVVTCSKRAYHMFDSNCGVFCDDIEKFTVQELGGQLMALDDTVVVPPLRSRVHPEAQPTGWLQTTYTRVWNMGLLFFVDMLIYVAMNLPWISSKIGVGRVDYGNASPPSEGPEQQAKMKGNLLKVPVLKHLTKMVKRPKRVLFPRRIRLDQLYSSRLRDYSAKFKA